MTPKVRKLGTETNRKNKTGLFDSKVRNMGSKKGGKIGAEVCRKKGIGAFFDKKLQSINGKKGAETNRKNKTGVYDSKVQSMGGKIGGKIGGKNHAYVIFEIDGICQQMTLGRMEKL